LSRRDNSARASTGGTNGLQGAYCAANGGATFRSATGSTLSAALKVMFFRHCHLTKNRYSVLKVMPIR
jgi:hypothetical protein